MTFAKLMVAVIISGKYEISHDLLYYVGWDRKEVRNVSIRSIADDMVILQLVCTHDTVYRKLIHSSLDSNGKRATLGLVARYLGL